MGLIGYFTFAEGLNVWKWRPYLSTKVLTPEPYAPAVNALLAEINAPDVKHDYLDPTVLCHPTGSKNHCACAWLG
jgi:hypothetical protein